MSRDLLQEILTYLGGVVTLIQLWSWGKELLVRKKLTGKDFVHFVYEWASLMVVLYSIFPLVLVAYRAVIGFAGIVSTIGEFGFETYRASRSPGWASPLKVAAEIERYFGEHWIALIVCLVISILLTMWFLTSWKFPPQVLVAQTLKIDVIVLATYILLAALFSLFGFSWLSWRGCANVALGTHLLVFAVEATEAVAPTTAASRARYAPRRP